MGALEITGKAGSTIVETVTDASQNLDSDTALAFKNSDGVLLSALLITVEDNGIKFCYGSTPVQSGLGHILSAGQSIYIRNPANARAFNYINEVNASVAKLMITPFYGEY